ncbi:hypothetical protein [Amycolatopsis minnesotensis]|uniref:Uncharacterized protein n=1 Tax=Amycolatopsis minnesotensis TaxID=337894 RepID=A0ABN2SA03_9PSEU
MSHLDLALDTALTYHQLVFSGRPLSGLEHLTAAALAAAVGDHYHQLAESATEVATSDMWAIAARKAYDTAARHELDAEFLEVLLP